MKGSIICHLYPIRGRWGNRGDMDRRLLQCFTSCALPARFACFSMATQPHDSKCLTGFSGSYLKRKETVALGIEPGGAAFLGPTSWHMISHVHLLPFRTASHGGGKPPCSPSYPFSCL